MRMCLRVVVKCIHTNNNDLFFIWRQHVPMHISKIAFLLRRRKSAFPFHSIIITQNSIWMIFIYSKNRAVSKYIRRSFNNNLTLIAFLIMYTSILVYKKHKMYYLLTVKTLGNDTTLQYWKEIYQFTSLRYKKFRSK